MNINDLLQELQPDWMYATSSRVICNEDKKQFSGTIHQENTVLRGSIPWLHCGRDVRKMSGEGKNGTCNCSVVSLHYILFDHLYNNTMLFQHLGALKKVLQRGQHSRIMSTLMLHAYLKIFNQNECMSPLRAVKLFAIKTKCSIVVQ